MTFESFEDIINYAMEKEREAAEFYADAAKQEPFAGVREALEEMAAEEKKHEALLKNLGENKELLENYELKWVTDIKRSNYMVDMQYEPGMHYVDLLRLAMKREEYALKMYNDLQTKTDNPDYINVFKMLCQEEAKHKMFLETLYDDYMAEQGD